MGEKTQLGPPAGLGVGEHLRTGPGEWEKRGAVHVDVHMAQERVGQRRRGVGLWGATTLSMWERAGGRSSPRGWRCDPTFYRHRIMVMPLATKGESMKRRLKKNKERRLVYPGDGTGCQ